MILNRKTQSNKQSIPIIFAWAWAVCFLFTYGFSSVLLIIEPTSKLNIFYLVVLSVVISLPMALFITGVLLFLHNRIEGANIDNKKIKDKVFNISISICMFGFFIALIGMHITIYTHISLGRPLVFLGVGLGCLTVSIFWLLRLMDYVKSRVKQTAE